MSSAQSPREATFESPLVVPLPPIVLRHCVCVRTCFCVPCAYTSHAVFLAHADPRSRPHACCNRCIKIALNETQSIKERRDNIARHLRGELSAPLTRELNERLDCKIIPEKWEGKVLAIVANKVGGKRDASDFF